MDKEYFDSMDEDREEHTQRASPSEWVAKCKERKPPETIREPGSAHSLLEAQRRGGRWQAQQPQLRRPAMECVARRKL